MFEIQEVAQAIRKNGLPQVKAQYFEYDRDSKIIGACAIGQAAVNLDTGFEKIEQALDTVKLESNCPADDCGITGFRLSFLITHLNDMHDYTFEQIADVIDNYARPS